MLLFPFNGKLFVCKDYYSEAKEVIDFIVSESALTLKLTEDALGAKYPEDIKFNCFCAGNGLIGSVNNISQEIKKEATYAKIALKNVKQGYAKCSTVVLDRAVISADKGICEAARALGADALLISAGGIELDGYDCGFIGGASGVSGKQIFFCGDITAHRDFERIEKFCGERGYEIVSLSDDPLYDIGTIMFL
jgi:hypothetical protein